MRALLMFGVIFAPDKPERSTGRELARTAMDVAADMIRDGSAVDATVADLSTMELLLDRPTGTLFIEARMPEAEAFRRVFDLAVDYLLSVDTAEPGDDEWLLYSVASTYADGYARPSDWMVETNVVQCGGCFRYVRRGVGADHAYRCPTGQNGPPDYN